MKTRMNVTIYPMTIIVPTEEVNIKFGGMVVEVETETSSEELVTLGNNQRSGLGLLMELAERVVSLIKKADELS